MTHDDSVICEIYDAPREFQNKATQETHHEMRMPERYDRFCLLV